MVRSPDSGRTKAPPSAGPARGAGRFSVPTVLVTGGAGYIGSHAVKALALAGNDVVVYDNLSAGHASAVAAVQDASQRRGHPPSRVRLVEGDIRDTGRLAAVLAETGADGVMHFAAWLAV